MLALVPALSLGACSETRLFGMGKKAPDEFAVVKTAPLSRPPDYSLRPPRPGAPRPQEGTPRDKAQSALFAAPAAGRGFGAGDGGFSSGQAFSSDGFSRNSLFGSDMADPAAAPARSVGEAAMFDKLGLAKADADIRQAIQTENSQIIASNRKIVDHLLFWKNPGLPVSVVDASAEARRLQENAATGKAPSEGTVPTRDRLPSSGTGGLLDNIVP